MLSLETAKALKEAGLKWEPRGGDYYFNPSPSENYPSWLKKNWLHWFPRIIGSEMEYYFRHDKYSVWLPRLDQLLAEIEKREWTWALYAPNDEGKCGIDIGKETLCRSNLLAMGNTPEEAAAQALLWILQKEEG